MKISKFLNLKVGALVALVSLLLTLPLPSAVTGQEGVVEKHFKAEQGDFCQEITPLAKAESAERFYDYRDFPDFSAHTGLERSNESLLFLYRDMHTKIVSLFVIHDAIKDGSGGEAAFSFSGLPKGTTLVVRDDSHDKYSFAPPQAQASWQWRPCCTDGLVISGIRVDELEIVIAPEFKSGIARWVLLSGDVNNPDRIGLPSLMRPVKLGLNQPPVAAFTFSPARPEPGKPVIFDASSSFDPDGTVVRYEWDFGDGNRSSKKNPTHIYQEPAIHKVTLKVTDNCGRSDIVRKIIIPQEVSASRTIVAFPSSAQLPDPDMLPLEMLPGIAFEVRVTLKANIDLVTIGLKEVLPKGWKAGEIPEDKADPPKFKGSEVEWIWTDLKAGDVIEVAYLVLITSEAKVDSVGMIKGDVEGFAPLFEIPVGGDSQVKVVSALSIPVVIASLEPYDPDPDPDNNDDINYYCVEWAKDDLGCYLIRPEPPYTIDDWEIEQANKFWWHEKAVPLTGGKTIDFKMLLKLYTYYKMQVPVTEPLSE